VYEAPGKVTIAPNVLTTIVRATTLEERGVHRLAPAPPNVRGLLAGGTADEGIFIEVTPEGVQIEVHIVADNGINLLKLGEALQCSITRAIEEMVGMAVAAVNVHVDDVVQPLATGAQ
jgi:uncharacterized alkaline shock family protein YloU